MATDRPQVVGGRVLAHRRVDAHRQRDDQADEDRQQPELGGDRQPSQHAFLDPPAAQQRLAESAAQENAADPAAVLDVNRQVQAQPAFYQLPVDGDAKGSRATDHDVDDVAGDEADRQEYQHAQDEQGRDDQQQQPDDVRSHIFVAIGCREARASRHPSLQAERAQKTVANDTGSVWSRLVEACSDCRSVAHGRLIQNPISRFRSWSIQRRARMV